MPRYSRVTVAQAADALRRSKGLLRPAAKALGCHPETLKRLIAASSTLQAIIEDEREGLVDLAESQLYLAVSRGERWAVQFVLRTRGSARGYVERHEIAGVSDQPVRVVLDLGEVVRGA